MHQKIVCYFAGLSSIVCVSPVYAHLHASHQMGLLDGLLHLVTESTHIFLLLPAIVVALLFILRKRGNTINQ